MTNYDFHFHSVYSDGRWDIDEILEYAKKMEMQGLILTDHDGVDAQDEFTQKAKKLGIKTSTGIEITTMHRETQLHILGYGIDTKNQKLREKMIENRNAKAERDLKLIEKLRNLGFILEEEKIKESRSKAKGYFGRVRIAYILLSEKENLKLLKDQTLKGTFDEYLCRTGKAWTPIDRMKTIEAIELIHQAGGIASLAHPAESTQTYAEFEKIAHELIKAGLDAIEVFSWKHTPEESKNYLDFAKNNNLLVTFGSDDHGYPAQKRTMGEIFVENDEMYAKKLFERIGTV